MSSVEYTNATPQTVVFALLSLFFKVPFDRKFGHAGFFIYWMLSWAGMLALGLALEAMVTLLTPRFIPFFLVLWIIGGYLRLLPWFPRSLCLYDNILV